jgi:hypothetical protein
MSLNAGYREALGPDPAIGHLHVSCQEQPDDLVIPGETALSRVRRIGR